MPFFSNNALLGAAGAGKFSPLDLPGIALWLDAADGDTITANGSNQVTQWRDKSGEARHVAPYAAATAPLTAQGTQNGRNYLLFGSLGLTGLVAGSDYLFATVANGGLSIIAAYDWAGVNPDGGAADFQFIYDFGRLSSTGTGLAVQRFYTPISHGGVSTTTGDTTANIASARIEFGTSKTQKRWFDGVFYNQQTISVPELTTTQISGNPTTGITSGPVSIGRQSKTTTDRYFYGRIYEIIVVRRAITDADREAAEQYLASKWSL